MNETNNLIIQNLDPKKLYYSPQEVAEILSVETHTLRYWEEEFSKQLKPHRDPKGRRQYTQKDIATLLQIKYLLKEEGLTIEGARNKFRSSTKDDTEKKTELYHRLTDLRNMLVELKQLITID